METLRINAAELEKKMEIKAAELENRIKQEAVEQETRMIESTNAEILKSLKTFVKVWFKLFFEKRD